MFRIVLDGQRLREVKQFVFNDGSVQIEIQGDVDQATSHVMIEAMIQTPTDQMGLVMLTNAVRIACPVAEIHCLMPFTPYGRQDAPFCPGQANAMKAWADVVNNLNFKTVTTMDPHSIAISHIDRCVPVDVLDILEITLASDLNFQLATDGYTLVSPDAGANKKAHAIAKKFGKTEIIRADKSRDLATGNILETIVYGDVDGEDCVIIDDICDGGMTFIKLAEKLKEKGAGKITLFVTHGIFSKGLSVFEGLIDDIFTTESWPQYDIESIKEGYSGNFVICSGR